VNRLILSVLLVLLLALPVRGQTPPNGGPRVAPFGQYLTAPPTYTSGAWGNLMIDQHGYLLFDCAVGCSGGGGSGGTVAQGTAGSSAWLFTTVRGVGSLTAVPAGSTNGTALGTMPSGATGVRFYLPSGASVTFTIASTAPSSAPSLTFTVSQSGTGPNWDEALGNGEMIYVTATSGSPLFRWN
jgi:hypothetical protein